jgi:hypothetical protein
LLQLEEMDASSSHIYKPTARTAHQHIRLKKKKENGQQTAYRDADAALRGSRMLRVRKRNRVCAAVLLSFHLLGLFPQVEYVPRPISPFPLHKVIADVAVRDGRQGVRPVS